MSPADAQHQDLPAAHQHLGQSDPPPPSLSARRPAETGTAAAGAIAFLAGRAFGWDAGVQGAVTVLVALVPAGVTWLVELVRRRR